MQKFIERFQGFVRLFKSPQAANISFQVHPCFVNKFTHCITDFIIVLTAIKGIVFIQILHRNVSKYLFLIFYIHLYERLFRTLQ
jgi:hypothetical protein